MATDYLSYGFGFLVLFGGMMGYAKKGSVMSAVMGCAFGSLLLYGAYLLSQDYQNLYLTLCVSLVLLLVMGARFLNSGKMMPAGLVTICSLVMVVRLGIRLYRQ